MKLTTKQLKKIIREELFEINKPMALDDEREERRKEAGLEDNEIDKLKDSEEMDPEYFHFLAGELGSEEEPPLSYDAFEDDPMQDIEDLYDLEDDDDEF
jgi:hypothetical protein